MDLGAINKKDTYLGNSSLYKPPQEDERIELQFLSCVSDPENPCYFTNPNLIYINDLIYHGGANKL